MGSLKVRLVSDKENDLKHHLLNLMASEKWRPGPEDVNSLFSGDPTSLFVGELHGGKPIGFVAFLKYDPSLYLFGFFVIEKEHRGRGYGMELYKTAVQSVLPSQNIVAYTVGDTMLKKYTEMSGFHAHWIVPRYDVHLLTALQNLSRLPPSDLYRAQRMDGEVDLQALFNYDASVFGYQRNNFLQTYLHAQGSHTRVAIDRKGIVVGYVVARLAFFKEEGYRLGPLYADSLEIAQVLLKALFEGMLEARLSTSSSILFDIPESQNVEAKKLAELLDGKCLYNLTFISTNGVPKGRFENWYALISGNFG